MAEDGTSLAVWVEGAGPALVLVHGSIADHTTFEPLVSVLRDDLTTFCMNRRGFGASPDEASPYAIERDFEDVAAVVDAVYARTGGSVALWGHSYGANCAMGAAARTVHLRCLVLYEPSFGLSYPPGTIAAIDEAPAAGNREAAIIRVLADVLEMTPAQIDALRAGPLWPTRLAVAHTVPRECRAEESWRFEESRFDAITVPTLLLAGTQSTPEIARATHAASAAIPHAVVRDLIGHGHFAHKTAPAMVGAIVRRFIGASAMSAGG